MPSVLRLRRFALPSLITCLALWGTGLAYADDLADVRRLQASGQRDAALKKVDQALLTSPRDAPLRFARGVLLSELERPTEALAVFESLSEDHPELPDPLNNIAVLQAAQGRLDAARAALEAALRNDPRHRAVRENLADVHVRLAVRLWQSLSSEGAAEPPVQRKLRLARELLRPE